MSRCAQELCPNWGGDGRVCPCVALDIEPPNDIEATGGCCCNGCIGEGLCDLAEPEERAKAWQWTDDAGRRE